MPRKSQPSKLFSLKEWLTLDDAAQHLSILFGEEVTVPTVLRLALDKHLTLSVDFVNHATVRKGKLVPLTECPFTVFPTVLKKRGEDGWRLPIKNVASSELARLPKDILDAIKAKDMILTPDAIVYRPDEYLVLEEKVSSIGGVWDLPMLGGESLDVEHWYQMETNGPAVTLTNLEGAFVERDGVICQLQEDFDDNEYSTGSAASLRRLKDHIRENEVSKDCANELLKKHAEQRKIFLEKRRNDPPNKRYYPAQGLPRDAVYVVRTSGLRAFEQSVLNAPCAANKPVSGREETTLLNIVGGLLGLLLGKSPAGKPHSVFKSQSAVIEALLAHGDRKPGMSARTLQEKFAAAKRSLES